MVVDSPRVSIGLPVYNGAQYLREAVESILDQTFMDFELVISDNGSSDDTELICRQYAEKDQRIRYYRYETNRGPGWNSHHVFELSRGEYFKWLAHDDRCAPQFLEKCVGALDANRSAVLCCSRLRLID